MDEKKVNYEIASEAEYACLLNFTNAFININFLIVNTNLMVKMRREDFLSFSFAVLSLQNLL